MGIDALDGGSAVGCRLGEQAKGPRPGCRHSYAGLFLKPNPGERGRRPTRSRRMAASSESGSILRDALAALPGSSGLRPKDSCASVLLYRPSNRSKAGDPSWRRPMTTCETARKGFWSDQLRIFTGVTHVFLRAGRKAIILARARRGFTTADLALTVLPARGRRPP